MILEDKMNKIRKKIDKDNTDMKRKIMEDEYG